MYRSGWHTQVCDPKTEEQNKWSDTAKMNTTEGSFNYTSYNNSEHKNTKQWLIYSGFKKKFW